MANQTGGALPFPMPPSATGVGRPVGRTDKQIAKIAAGKLVTAIKNTHDPELKAAFSQSLASLNKYLAQDSKARKQGSVSKTSTVKDPKPAKK